VLGSRDRAHRARDEAVLHPAIRAQAPGRKAR